MVQPRQKDTEIKVSSKITSLVTEVQKGCVNCCFYGFKELNGICDFIKCTFTEREDRTSVIFKIE